MVSLGLILVLAVSVLAPPAVSKETNSGQGRSQKMKAAWNNISEAKKEMGLAKADEHRQFAKFQYDATSGNATGRFVTFKLLTPTGTIQNFTVKNGTASTEFFDAITPSTYTAGDTPYVTGAVLHIPSTNLTIRAHNNPTTLTSWQSGVNGLNVTFKLHAGATLPANATKDVKVTIGSLHGHIVTNGNATPVFGSGQVMVKLDKGEKVMFRAHPSGVAATQNLHDANAAFASGKLGAVVTVADGGGVAIEDIESNDVDVETTHIENQHVMLEADASVTGSRVLFIMIVKGTIDGSKLDRLIIKVGGAAAQKVSTAANATASTMATYSVTDTVNGTQFVINVPHFSAQDVNIDQREASSATDSGAAEAKRTPGLGLLAIAAALGLGGLAGRRRRA